MTTASLNLLFPGWTRPHRRRHLEQIPRTHSTDAGLHFEPGNNQTRSSNTDNDDDNNDDDDNNR